MNCAHCFKEVTKGYIIEYSYTKAKTYWHLTCALHALNMLDALKIHYEKNYVDGWETVLVADDWVSYSNRQYDKWRRREEEFERRYAYENAMLKRKITDVYSDIASIQPPPPIIIKVDDPNEFIKRWRKT